MNFYIIANVLELYGKTCLELGDFKKALILFKNLRNFSIYNKDDRNKLKAYKLIALAY